MSSIKNPNSGWKFNNGDYVFHKDGSQIDPSSPEGKQIQTIWDFQDNVMKIDENHRIHFAWVTYPNDTTSRQALLTSWGIDPEALDPGPN
jgi:hypothetical protein